LLFEVSNTYRQCYNGKGAKMGCENLVFKDMGDGMAEITVDVDTVDKLLFWEFNDHSY